MSYFVAAVAACGVFMVAGWRSKEIGSAANRRRWALPKDPLWGEDEIDNNAIETESDVAAAIRTGLQRLAPVMQRQLVKAEIAAPSGLLVRMRGGALADLMEEFLAAAIQGAPASRLLLTAALQGDRIHVGITDDMPGADPAVRAGSVRGLMERLALRGGGLNVEVHPAEGTTMTLRLAAAIKSWDGSPAMAQI